MLSHQPLKQVLSPPLPNIRKCDRSSPNIFYPLLLLLVLGLAWFSAPSFAQTAGGNKSPVAAFTATPDQGKPPLTVVLNASGSTDSDGSVVKYDWFINGQAISLATETDYYVVDSASVDTAQVPIYDSRGNVTGQKTVTITRKTVTITFKKISTYTIVLKVTDNRGLTHQTQRIVKVQNCTFNIVPTSRSHQYNAETGSVSVSAGAGCDWTASRNTSWVTIKSGSHGQGNGTVTYSITTNSSTQSRSGTLTIAGRTFTISQAGKPDKKAPVACFTASPTTGNAPLTVTLNFSCSKDSDGRIVRYDWAVNGQPISPIDTSNTSIKRMVFQAAGTYTIVLKVTDNDGLTHQTQKTVKVDEGKKAPVACFTASPTTGNAPLTVTLNFSCSKDSDGRIVRYDWAVNGQPISPADSSDAPSSSVKKMTFSSAGTFGIVLKVTDNDGLTGQTQRDVKVAQNAVTPDIYISPTTLTF